MFITHSIIDEVKFAYNSFWNRCLAKKSTGKRNGIQNYKSKQSFWSLIVLNGVNKILECMETSKTSVCVSYVSKFIGQTDRKKTHLSIKLTRERHIRRCSCNFNTFMDYSDMFNIFKDVSLLNITKYNNYWILL